MFYCYRTNLNKSYGYTFNNLSLSTDHKSRLCLTKYTNIAPLNFPECGKCYNYRSVGFYRLRPPGAYGMTIKFKFNLIPKKLFKINSGKSVTNMIKLIQRDKS